MPSDQDEVIYQGPGYTIARSTKAETLVPYGRATRENGDQNHGFIDLRGRPDLVDLILEAQKSEGMRSLLVSLAKEDSALMSSGCECGLFDQGESAHKPRFLAGGYVNVMFKDAGRNIAPESIQDIASYVLNGIGGSPDHFFQYEMIVEPLKGFFGRQDCFALMLKPLGFGEDESAAWAAFNFASRAAANSLSRDSSDGTALPKALMERLLAAASGEPLSGQGDYQH